MFEVDLHVLLTWNSEQAGFSVWYSCEVNIRGLVFGPRKGDKAGSLPN